MTTIKKPSREIITLTHRTDSSPKALLADTPEATAWVEEALEEITQELTDRRHAFYAPEHFQRAYLDSLKMLLERLQTKQPVELWEAHRELGRVNPYLNDEGFTAACSLLFG